MGMIKKRKEKARKSWDFEFSTQLFRAFLIFFRTFLNFFLILFKPFLTFLTNQQIYKIIFIILSLTYISAFSTSTSFSFSTPLK